MLRRHPHLQGLVLGMALLATAGAATPYAVGCVRDLETSPAGESVPAQPIGKEATLAEPKNRDAAATEAP